MAVLLCGCPKAEAPAPPTLSHQPGRYCFFIAPALLELGVDLTLDAKGGVEGVWRKVDIDEAEETRLEEVFHFKGKLVGEQLELSGAGAGDAPRAERWGWSDGGLITGRALISPAPCRAR